MNRAKLPKSSNKYKEVHRGLEGRQVYFKLSKKKYNEAVKGGIGTLRGLTPDKLYTLHLKDDYVYGLGSRLIYYILNDTGSRVIIPLSFKSNTLGCLTKWQLKREPK